MRVFVCAPRAIARVSEGERSRWWREKGCPASFGSLPSAHGGVPSPSRPCPRHLRRLDDLRPPERSASELRVLAPSRTRRFALPCCDSFRAGLRRLPNAAAARVTCGLSLRDQEADRRRDCRCSFPVVAAAAKGSRIVLSPVEKTARRRSAPIDGRRGHAHW